VPSRARRATPGPHSVPAALPDAGSSGQVMVACVSTDIRGTVRGRDRSVRCGHRPRAGMVRGRRRPLPVYQSWRSAPGGRATSRSLPGALQSRGCWTARRAGRHRHLLIGRHVCTATGHTARAPGGPGIAGLARPGRGTRRPYPAQARPARPSQRAGRAPATGDPVRGAAGRCQVVGPPAYHGPAGGHRTWAGRWRPAGVVEQLNTEPPDLFLLFVCFLPGAWPRLGASGGGGRTRRR